MSTLEDFNNRLNSTEGIKRKTLESLATKYSSSVEHIKKLVETPFLFAAVKMQQGDTKDIRIRGFGVFKHTPKAKSTIEKESKEFKASLKIMKINQTDDDDK